MVVNLILGILELSSILLAGIFRGAGIVLGITVLLLWAEIGSEAGAIYKFEYYWGLTGNKLVSLQRLDEEAP